MNQTPGPNQRLIGKEEWCSLPDLGLPWVKARVDSGARTSALHAWHIRRFQRDGRDWLSFRIHPLQRDRRTVVACEAPVADRRGVRSSSGASESRYVIRTCIGLAGERFPVEITLTNRDSMGYRMLLGREAMQRGLIVDPSRSFLGGEPSARILESCYQRHRAKTPHLNIGLLCGEDDAEFSIALRTAASARKHRLQCLDVRRFELRFDDHQESLRCAQVMEPGHLDVILSLLPRHHAGTAGVLLRHFEHLGAWSPNCARAILENSDQVVAWQRLVRSSVITPRSRWRPVSVQAEGEPDPPIRRVMNPAADGEMRIDSVFDPRSHQQPSSQGPALLTQWLPAASSRNLVRCYVAGARILTVALSIDSNAGAVCGSDKRRVLSRMANAAIRRAVRALGVSVAVVDALCDGDDVMVLAVDPFAIDTAPVAIAKDYAVNIIRHFERRAGVVTKVGLEADGKPL